MKTTIRIAKLELNNLFFSPLAWIILVGFSIYTASSIFSTIEQKAFSQYLYDSISYSSITKLVLTNPKNGYFFMMTKLLMVLIPLLAMGVISREASSGTIKLLYSSPIKLSSIVLGKFMALLFFVCLLTVIAALGILAVYLTVGLEMEMGIAMSAIISMFLLGVSIAAITVFVSTFSAYPIVDAVATIAVVFGFDLIYGLVNEIPVINEIMFWVSPTAQVADALNGLLTSKTIGYFVVLTLLFVLLSIARMQLIKQNLKVMRLTRLKMLGMVTAAFVAIYILIQPAMLWYTDTTSNQSNRLSPLSMELMEPLKKEPIKIITYSNILTEDAYSFLPKYILADEINRFSKYMLEYPQIEFEYVYYYNESMKDLFLQMQRKDPTMSMDSLIAKYKNTNNLSAEILSLNELALSDEIKNEFGTKTFRILESNGKQSVLMTNFDDPIADPMEAEILTAFYGLIQEPVQLGYARGHGERGLTESIPVLTGYAKPNAPENWDRSLNYYTCRRAFVNNGFKVSDIKLEQAVPSGMDVLVIADPKEAFSEIELTNLKSYIERGGHLLVAGEPGSQDILNPITEDLGITFQEGILVNDNPSYPADYTLAMINHQYFGKEFQSLAHVQMPGATALAIEEKPGFKYANLLTSKANETWIDLEGPNEYGEAIYQPESGHEKAALPLMVRLEREVKGKKQYIIVSSDADFLSNGRLSTAPAGIRVANGRMSQLFSRLFSNNVYPFNIPFPKASDVKVQMEYESIAYLKWIYFLLIPGIFLAFGINMLMKRMRN